MQGSGSRVQGVGSYRRGLQPQGLQLIQLDWVPFERYLRWGLEFYLTECVYQLVLESQLPNKLVNLLFTITD